MRSRAQLAPTEEVCLNLGKHRFQVMGSRAQLAPTEEATIASKAVTPIANREHSSLLQKSYGIASTARSYRRVMGSRAQLAPTMCEGFARIKDAET